MYSIVLIIIIIGFNLAIFGQTQINVKEFYKIDTSKLNEVIEKTLDYGQPCLLGLSIANFSLIKPQKRFMEIFYNNSPILQYPNKDSSIVEILNFKDSVYIPQFNFYRDVYKSFYILDPSIGDELSHPDFYLCISKIGNVGFIHSNNLMGCGLQQDSTTTLYFGGYGKSALAKNDKSKIIYFDSYNIQKSNHRNRYIYSVINDSRSIQNSPIYLFDTDAWEEDFIAYGNNPTFLNDSTIVFYQFENSLVLDSQVISLYNLKTNSSIKIFTPPEGFTLVYHGEDGNELEELKISEESSTITFYINENTEPDCLEIQRYLYVINEKGEVQFTEKEY